MRVLLCPGTAKEQSFKRWPVDSFLTLGKLMEEAEIEVTVILGKQEEEMRSKFNSFSTIYSPSLDELKELASNFLLVVCNDSFLMHFFSEQNIKVLAIYGPTDPSRTKPISSNIVKTSSNLDCMPCWGTNLYGHCPFELKCLQTLKPGEVYVQIKEILGFNDKKF